MSGVDLKSRWDYLLNLRDNEEHLNKKFKFKLIKNHDISEIRDLLLSYTDEDWGVESMTQELYKTQKDTNSIMVAWVPNSFHTQHIPFQIEKLCIDDKLYDLVTAFANEIADLYGGKHGRIWIARLPAGKEIPRHIDHFDHFTGMRASDELYALAVHRIQLSITTNDDVWFDMDGDKLHMEPGECWEINHHVPHEVVNNGDTDRIHICIDILPYKWL